MVPWIDGSMVSAQRLGLRLGLGYTALGLGRVGLRLGLGQWRRWWRGYRRWSQEREEENKREGKISFLPSSP